MKKEPILNYTFAVGKIRALEKSLIKQGVFEEAIESNLPEALKLFAESALYGDGLLHIENSRQLEDVLDEELARLKKLISELLLDKPLLAFLELDTIKCAGVVLKDYADEFLGDFIRHMIDMHNIKSFLRLYILKKPPQELEEALTCEGFIKRGDFLKLYEQSLAAFLLRLEYVHKRSRIMDYAFYLGEAIQHLEQGGSFVLLEKAINDFLIEVLKPAKYITFGPQPLLAYYFAKVNEINLMRMIIMAKLNNMDKEILNERLNLVYA